MLAHPRICVNSICSLRQPLDADIALWTDLGIDHVGLIAPKSEAAGWAAGQQAVLEAKLEVSSMAAYRHEMVGSLPLTAAVGCRVLYTLSGPGGSVTWEEAARTFCEEMAPFL